MSTFVEIRPIESPDTKTTAIRLDEDFKLTVRTEKGGSHTDRQYNFSGLLEGQHVAETNDVASVRISKSGTDERAIVAVSTYHAAGDEGWTNFYKCRHCASYGIPQILLIPTVVLPS